MIHLVYRMKMTERSRRNQKEFRGVAGGTRATVLPRPADGARSPLVLQRDR
ncbi:hypothetical protein ACU686_11020 [Yinghuangia aomiensis]